MIRAIKRKIIQMGLKPEEHERVEQVLRSLNSAGYDPWGVAPEDIKASLATSLWLYRNYFRVETMGVENIPSGRALLVANHSGQVPIDGMLLATSMLLEANPPRLVRGMVERWAPKLPFVSTWFARTGQITGDHHNCKELLENEQMVMVFPEGVGGSGKSVFKRYELQRFGTGFLRLALETKTPIVPCAIIGCEESLPSLSGLQGFAKKIGIPYLPIIPTGPLPLPTKVTIRISKSLLFDLDPGAPEKEIQSAVDTVQLAIRQELDTGLAIRGERIFTGSGIS